MQIPFFSDHFYTQAPAPNQQIQMEAQVLPLMFSSPLEPLCASRSGDQGERAAAEHEPAPESPGVLMEVWSLSFCQSGWGLEIYILGMFPGDAAAAGTM